MQGTMGDNSSISEKIDRDGNKVTTDNLSWWFKYKKDLRRYTILRIGEPLFNIFLTEQALWTLFQYRVASRVFQSRLPWQIKRPILLGLVLWQKLVEIFTGIYLPYRTKIGLG